MYLSIGTQFPNLQHYNYRQEVVGVEIQHLAVEGEAELH